MEDNFNFFVALFAILPFILGLVVFAVYRYGISIKNTSLQEMEIAASRLRQLRTAFRSHQRLVQTMYSEDEPYQSRITKYRELVLLCETHLNKLHLSYKNLRQEVNDKANNRNQLFGMILAWRQVLPQVTELSKGLDSFQSKLEELDRLWDVIDNLAWDVAVEIQSINSQILQSMQDVRQLLDWGWRGDSLEKLRTSVYDLIETIRAQIPLVFLSPDPGVVLAQTEAPDVIRVHRIANSIKDIAHENSEMSRAIMQAVVQLPASLDEIKKRLEIVQQTIITLGKAENFPIRFDNLARKHSNLASHVVAISQGFQTRSIENLLGQESQILSLQSRSAALEQDAQALEKTHSALVAGALTDEILNGDRILINFNTIIKWAAHFHEADFDRGDDIKSLPAELQDLSRNFEKVQDLFPVQSISESEIQDRLKAIEAYRTGFILLNPRFTSVKRSLDRLIQQESHLRQDLDKLVETVNRLLENVVPANQSKKLKGYNQQAFNLLTSLESPAESPLASRMKALSSLTANVTAEVRFWDEKMHDSLIAILSQTRKELDDLSAISKFNDPVISEFAVFEHMIEVEESSPDVNLSSFTDLSDRVEKVSNQLNTLAAMSSRLKALAGPVLTLSGQIEKKRTHITSLMEFLTVTIPEDGFGWPPNAQRFSGEDLLVNRLDQEYRSLKNEPVEITLLSSRLQELDRKYTTLERKLEELHERVVQDQGKFNHYLERIAASRKIWESLRVKHKNSLVFIRAVDEFLKDNENKLQNLETQYRKGHYPHPQALSLLRTIAKSLDESQLDYDTHHVIDINGYLDLRSK